MLRNIKYLFDSNEFFRKIKRLFDGNFSYRKIFIVLLTIVILFMYLGPIIFRSIFSRPENIKDPILRCMDDRLTPFYIKNLEANANIRHQPVLNGEYDYLPYVGNGYFGLEIADDACINIKNGRHLGLPIYYHPIISVEVDSVVTPLIATVVDYQNGIVHKFQCMEDYFISYDYYAHRHTPNVFVQEIKLTNTKNQIISVHLTRPRISNWPSATTRTINLDNEFEAIEYSVISGIIELKNKQDQVIAVTIVQRNLPRAIALSKRGVTTYENLMTINYSNRIPRTQYERQKIESEKVAIDAMRRASKYNAQNNGLQYHNFKRQHTFIWNNLWSTGFSISSSKATNSINGDKINASMYVVLSHARTYEFEESISESLKNDIAKSLSYAEGCYDDYHTLQAENLWNDLATLTDINNLVASWLLTLEKQGCHNLIKAGATGVVQAMVLSFGGFRFSNQHLELNIHPKYLHRDYFFKRINYGNMTHVNVSILVTDTNKAVIEVALDRSDGHYYACDAGCLDEPIYLSQKKQTFPVKLTEPLTAIMYITSDKEHIEELHHAIHVKEVVEAPALEHHIIALHKHGHHLGGLPTLFWISVCAIIVMFHIFLCKLIVKEYCEPPDKYRYRYSKP